MNAPLYTFNASVSSDQITFWTTLFIALVALVGLVFLIRRKVDREAYNRNALLSMLTFFAFLIAASTAFFSSWSMKKTGPVYIYSDRIELPSGNVPFSALKNVSLKKEAQRSMIDSKQSNREVKLLLIEEKTGKLHVLSELNYPVAAILNKLGEAQKAWGNN